MSLEALADAIQVDPSDIVRTLFMKGIMLSLNQVGVVGSLLFMKGIMLSLNQVGVVGSLLFMKGIML
jgi:hypothetical protein